jgi:hypothetical protein
VPPILSSRSIFFFPIGENILVQLKTTVSETVLLWHYRYWYPKIPLVFVIIEPTNSFLVDNSKMIEIPVDFIVVQAVSYHKPDKVNNTSE